MVFLLWCCREGNGVTFDVANYCHASPRPCAWLRCFCLAFQIILGDLFQSFTVLWVFCNSWRNCWVMVQRQNRQFHAQVHRIPNVLGCQEYPAASIFAFL